VTLQDRFANALLFRRIATADLDAPVSDSVDDLEWTGPTDAFAVIAERIGGPQLDTRARKIAADRSR
jgi:hypothetical protein